MAAMKKDLLASKTTLVEARDAVVALTEEISQKNCYLEFLRKKLQEMKPRIIKLSNSVEVLLKLSNQEG